MFTTDKTPNHLPTPSEIDAACDLIKSTWTESERTRRRRAMPQAIDVDASVKRAASENLELRLMESRER